MAIDANIHNQKQCPIVLQTGFRIFFIGASLFSILSIIIWMGYYVFNWNALAPIPMMNFHAHEMIFGYTLAVVAGFLLTAVMNWTGLKTLDGTPLFILFFLWAVARVMSFVPGDIPMRVMAVSDLGFVFYLTLAIMRPIIKVGQWRRQSTILSILLLICVSSVLFYLGYLGILNQGMRQGIYFALYMIVALILTIARRVIPFFVEKGVGYQVKLRQSKVLDLTGLILLGIFAVLDTFWPHLKIIPALSVLLSAVYSACLSGWYTKGIWKKPLLWVLFVGYSFLILGFALKALGYIFNLLPFYSLHAFTYGGIGIFSLGMMARVSFGHTGRNLNAAPPQIFFIFMVLILGACARVIIPIFDAAHYRLWIAIAQILWIMAFSVFMYIYFPVLTSKRPDGKFG